MVSTNTHVTFKSILHERESLFSPMTKVVLRTTDVESTASNLDIERYIVTESLSL